MTYETKKRLQERFLAVFSGAHLRRRKATRVYMPVGNLFKDADVHKVSAPLACSFKGTSVLWR